MYKLLLVDDSATELRLLEGLLKKSLHFHVSTAMDGLQALEMMKSTLPDVVVTDLQMPNLDGLHLVERVRQLYPTIPVILITGEGSEEIAAQALQRGAAGYVPKSRSEEMLIETVDDVLAMTRSESSFDRIIDCAEVSFFQFAFANDISVIAPIFELAQRMTVSMGVCDEPGGVQVGVALEHAILNAIYHGNLELPSGSHIDRELMEKRLREQPYMDRRVHVEMRITRTEAKFLIRDEGPGFNVKAMASIGQHRALTGDGGRGLLLMWAFMDTVTYDTKGSTVILVKRRDEHAVAATQNQQAELTEAASKSNATDDSSSTRTTETDKTQVDTAKPNLPAVLGRLIPSDGSPSILLKKPRLTVGRDPSCDVVIRSGSVSQHHCLLYVYQGWWYVKDMKSKNGIRVNHSSCTEHLLRPESSLSVGKHEYRVEYEPYKLGADGIDPPADPF